MDKDVSNANQDQPSEPTLKEKTATGLFWGGISNLVQQVIGAGFGIAIARILSPDDYGLIGMLLIFTAVANTLMDSGFTVALVNKKEIRHEDYNAVFWFSIFLGITIYIILFFSAPLIAKFYDRPILINLSRLLFVSFLISSMGFAHNAILFKKLMVKERAKIDVVAVTVSGSVGLILALCGFAYRGLAIQAVLMSGISVLLRWRYAPWKPTLHHIDLSPLKSMIGFSSKLLITNIFTQVSSQILSVILGKSYGETQVGYYSQGYKWMQLCNMVISGMMSSVAQPVFVEANEDKDRQLQIFRKMIRFGAFVSFPAMFGLAFIGREFILIALGEKWIESVPVLKIFCIVGGFWFLFVLYYHLLSSLGKSNIIMWYSLFVASMILATIIIVNEIDLDFLIMVICYAVVTLLSFVGWHFLACKFIGLRLIHVLKDISFYLIITIGCLMGTQLLTKPIQNIFFLCFSKIIIFVILYFVIMKFSPSKIFKESMGFIMRFLEKKEDYN